MGRALTDNCCMICGIPLDAEYFDVSGFVGEEEIPADPELQLLHPRTPTRGEQKVLASFQLHPQYCGVLTYFSQYTDLMRRIMRRFKRRDLNGSFCRAASRSSPTRGSI